MLDEIGDISRVIVMAVVHGSVIPAERSESRDPILFLIS
jgi:hypothetical protein